MNSLTLHQPDFVVCTPLHITNLDKDRNFTRTKLLREDWPSECTPKTFHCRICVQFRILKKLRLLRAWLHGEFQPWLKFCCDYMTNFSPGWNKQNHYACPSSLFSPRWNYVSITWEIFRFSGPFATQPGLKILARFEQTGLGFSARAELRPGLNPSPCNRQFDFKRICLRSRAEVSARLTRWNFSPGWNSPCNQALKQTNKQTNKKRKTVSKLGDKGQDPTDPTNHWIRHFDPVTRYFHMQ